VLKKETNNPRIQTHNRSRGSTQPDNAASIEELGSSYSGSAR
jgi:hypothetical protein